LGDEPVVEECEPEVQFIAYANRQEAMAEVVLEGGDGDAVHFWKVKPGSRAATSGMMSGDQLVQVNGLDSELLFWRPAADILSAIQGPVVLAWKSVPPRPEDEKTRLNPKKPRFTLEEDVDEDDVVQPYPVSKATAADVGEWLCGSCHAKNFDNQEFCRRCGIRDSRLPKRAGEAPVFNVSNSSEFKPDKPPMLFPSSQMTKRGAHEAAVEGQKLDDSTGQPVHYQKVPQKRL